MSEVTNVILSFSIVERSNENHFYIIDDINAWLMDEGYGYFCNTLNKGGFSCGHKELETPVYVAAFNYFDVREFISYIKILKFEEPEDVQVFIQSQHVDKFTIFEPFKA